MKFLIFDNTRDVEYFGSSNIARWVLKVAEPGTEAHVRRPPHQDLPNFETALHQYAGLIISGSGTSCLNTDEPWVRPYIQWVGKWIEAKRPVLGICYGHQTIARYFFEKEKVEPKLRKTSTPECGWQEIQVLNPDKNLNTGIFSGLTERFYTYESHYEEVYELPPGAQHLAKSPRCMLQGFSMTHYPVYAVQFHPETGIEQVEKTLQIKLKRGDSPDWILNMGRGKQLYNENVGKVIFGNFTRICSESLT